MSEIADRYRRLAGAFTDKVDAVPPDRWEQPSPCSEWTARQLVGHVADSQGLILGMAGGAVGERPSVDDDPLGSWTVARDAVQAALDDPATAGTEFDGLMGRTTLEQAVDRFLAFDLVVHGWDLARATGLDEAIGAEDLARVEAGIASFGDMLYSPGVCGPAVEVPADADEQTKVLARLGRRA